MKKVLHFTYCFFEGVGSFIYNVVTNHEIFTPILAGIVLRHISHSPADNIYKLGIFALPKPGMNFFPPYRKRILFSLHKIIRDTNPLLIHAHYGPWGCFILPLKKMINIPLVTTFYGYDISLPARRRIWVKLYHELFEKADLFLVEGEFMRYSLIKLGCPANKIAIQRIGIDFSKLTPIARENKILNIVFAGNFREKKGIMEALQAINLLRKEFTNFTFTLIGDGRLMPKVKNFIYQNKMSSYTKLLGSLPFDKYIDELKKSDIFLHPSQTAPNGDTEGGAPTTILEAQSLEIPVVSTFHADIPNVVIPGKTALLSKERDIEGIYQNLKFLLQNPQQHREMGKLGRECMIRNHSLKKTIPDLEQKYLQLLR